MHIIGIQKKCKNANQVEDDEAADPKVTHEKVVADVVQDAPEDEAVENK